MNPESQPSGCGVPPQSVQGASRSESISQEGGKTPLNTPSANPDADEFRMGLELERLEKTYSEPDYDDGYDDARERELLMDDLADDNDDFARSEEEGWYYSDED